MINDTSGTLTATPGSFFPLTPCPYCTPCCPHCGRQLAQPLPWYPQYPWYTVPSYFIANTSANSSSFTSS